jgi:hypothetical protein
MKHIDTYKIFLNENINDENINIIKDILSYISDDELNVEVRENDEYQWDATWKKRGYVAYIYKSYKDIDDEEIDFKPFEISNNIIDTILELIEQLNCSVYIRYADESGRYRYNSISFDKNYVEKLRIKLPSELQANIGNIELKIELK